MYIKVLFCRTVIGMINHVYLWRTTFLHLLEIKATVNCAVLFPVTSLHLFNILMVGLDFANWEIIGSLSFAALFTIVSVNLQLSLKQCICASDLRTRDFFGKCSTTIQNKKGNNVYVFTFWLFW